MRKKKETLRRENYKRTGIKKLDDKLLTLDLNFCRSELTGKQEAGKQFLK